jgi:hypothetical protein
MTHCSHDHRHGCGPREPGDATGEFAQRIARDAQRFGERVAEHASEFARNVAREWRHAGFGTSRTADDVRGVLKDVRGLVADVIDGVDELLVRLVRPEPADGWVRVVTSREVDCVGCRRRIGAGSECHLHRTREGREFRCAECGPPSDEPAPSV